MFKKKVTLFLLVILPNIVFADIHLDNESVIGKYRVEYAGAFSALATGSYVLNLKEDSLVDFLTLDGSGNPDLSGLNCEDGEFILENDVLVTHLNCIVGSPENQGECTKVTTEGNCFMEITTVVNLADTSPEKLKEGIQKRIHLSTKGLSNRIPIKVTKLP